MIRNAQNADKERLLVPFSKTKFEIAKILKEAGFLSEVEKKKKKIKKTEHNFLEIKINQEGSRSISGIKLISKPSRRIYTKKNAIKPVMSGFGFSLISTSQGMMNGEEARQKNLGGELIAEIW